MILQSFPSISTNKPEFVFMVLFTLILIGMVKELMADCKRFRTDKSSNALPTQLVTGKCGDKKTLNRGHLGCADDNSPEFAKRLEQLLEWSRL